jgi:lipid-binding SYLF domain-containing protein
MKFNTPLPQTLPKECTKAAKIFSSFVDNKNNGLDGVIPRSVLENAKGFAIFTVFKAGFLFSARAGTGIVIAKLDDGSWSAPSAIGSAGLGVGGQLGAEMTDFLIILNSTSAVRSFMSAGNLTLGGNMSVAVGPLGRNGEAIGSLNSSGKVAAMYSYSKTRGLFGGVSIEGSVIVERQDANTLAYKQDVTAKILLSGAIPCPEWASPLVKTLESCIGLPGNRKWVDDGAREQPGYVFASPKSEGSTPSFLSRKKKGVDFPPEHWGKRSESGSYFTRGGADVDAGPTPWDVYDRAPQSGSDFDTKFRSDPAPPSQNYHRSFSSVSASPGLKERYDPASPFNSLPPFSSAHSGLSDRNSTHSRSMSVPPVKQSSSQHSLADYTNPFASSSPPDDNFFESDNQTSYRATPFIKTKAELASSVAPGEGVSRAIALYDFNAVEAGDLSFSKGDVIIVTKKSDSTDDWWTGKVGSKEGIFPANFVETV